MEVALVLLFITGVMSSTWPPGISINIFYGSKEVNVVINGTVCQDLKIPDVPQPGYGETGRIGSYVEFWGQSGIVCGGYAGQSPPFSNYKDCQILDLDTKTWREGPELIKNAASGLSKIVGNVFYIFGGQYPTNPGPGPTVWIKDDSIQALDLNNIEEGWKIVQDVDKE